MARRRSSSSSGSTRTGLIVNEGAQIAAWSAELPDAYLLCRDMGHLWRPYRATYVSEDQCYRRVLRCGRCRTERLQDIGLDGVILSGTYAYADGYVAPPGTGRLDTQARGSLRLESTLRLIGKDDGR